jgi:nucleoside-diphosphate-sugar epimerase
MKKKILILGSSGQIGAELCRFLKQRYIVWEFDLENSNKEDLRVKSNKKFIKLIKNSDFVIFLAFDVGGSRYLAKYQSTYEFTMNNIKIMENVFEELKKNEKKFIFASSQMSNMVVSQYGLLKKCGELLTEKLSGITVRFWNVYGIEKNINKSHLITDLIMGGLKKQRKYYLRTDGTEERDFLHAKDCCTALEIIMKKFDFFRKKKFIDLRYGKFTKVLNVCKIVKKLMNKKKIEVEFIPLKKKDDIQNKKNTGDNYFFKFWKPKISLEKGIKMIFDHHYKEYIKK